MPVSIALPSFRRAIRRQMSTKTPGHPASENTPLLGNGEASNPSHVQSNGGGNHRSNTHRTFHRHPGSNTIRFLFHRDATPGMDSDNIAVKSLAYLWHITKVTLLSNYVNFLLVMVPIGIVAGKLHWDATVVFTLNFFAIIPLAAVLSFATEEIAEKLGKTLGGLLNATFGNAVELIVSIVALKDNQIEVVQASMLGSILSNILLVMGMCFLLGGIVHRRDKETGEDKEQEFNDGIAQTTCSMMTLSSASLVLPAALYGVLNQGHRPEEETKKSILILSRGTSIILLLLYVLYLVFQLVTHTFLFKTKAEKEQYRAEREKLKARNSLIEARGDAPLLSDIQTPADVEAQDSETQDSEEHPEPSMGPIAAGAVLLVTTVLVSICADYLVGSIDDIVKSTGMSKAFIGLILLPIVGNAAEHVTAVVVAMKDDMDLAMGVAIGSSVQIALLVTPFLVIVGWIIEREMTLRFETFQTVAFAVSVLIVTYAVQDGKSNYLEGAMLLGLYVIIALAFYATPGLDNA